MTGCAYTKPGEFYDPQALPTNQANAALIADAPTLLSQRDQLADALRALLHAYAECEDDGEEQDAAILNAQSALASLT